MVPDRMNKVKSNDLSPRYVEGQEGRNEISYSTVTYVLIMLIEITVYVQQVLIFLSLLLFQDSSDVGGHLRAPAGGAAAGGPWGSAGLH